MASRSLNQIRYDVYLSFRGPDTRNNFIHRIHEALKRAEIGSFLDDDDIERGEELEPVIERAIKESRASIVVFSKNYATSAWCLEELRLILEQRRERDHFVLPIFYHVDPSDVWKQQRGLAIKVQSSGKWTQHNVNLWKAALTELATLPGLVLDGHESKLVADIVRNICNRLNVKLVSLPSNLTGMDSHHEGIKTWLEQPDVEVLTICGMGGIGKTTLAKYILDSNWQNFENVSFVGDIGRRCEEPGDLIRLQESLVRDILGDKKRKIPSISQGTHTIEEALKTKRLLVVLDDIDALSKLATLIGTGKFNTQSKIIITARVLNTEEWFKSRDWRCREYQMKLLNGDESLQLVSRHAFRSETPTEGFEELSVKAVQYCGGILLALEVLGSSLFFSTEHLGKRNSIPLWESTLNSLERDIHPGIHGILLRSYYSLPHNSDKELFLHIACFCIGKGMDYVVKELGDSVFAGIKNLTNRCLLSVSPNNKLMMHQLLQEMGRTIVYGQLPKDPAKHRTGWHNWKSYDLLRKGKGWKTMEGLALDTQMLREDKYTYKKIVLSVNFDSQTRKNRVMESVNAHEDIDVVEADFENGRLTIIGDFDTSKVVSRLRKIQQTIEILILEPAEIPDSEICPPVSQA